MLGNKTSATYKGTSKTLGILGVHSTRHSIHVDPVGTYRELSARGDRSRMLSRLSVRVHKVTELGPKACFQGIAFKDTEIEKENLC